MGSRRGTANHCGIVPRACLIRVTGNRTPEQVIVTDCEERGHKSS